MKTSLSTLDADIAQFEPYDNLLFPIVAPAILPPVNNTCEPVISPVFLTVNTPLPLPARDDAPAKNRVSPAVDNPVYLPPCTL